MGKTRAWKQHTAVAARHRKAAKAAHQRKRGRYDTLTSEQKRGHEKRAFKAMIATPHVQRVLAPQMAAELPFLAALMKPRKLEIEIPDTKPFKPFQSNRKARVIPFPVWRSRKASGE